jgi:hypothetical protein
MFNLIRKNIYKNNNYAYHKQSHISDPTSTGSQAVVFPFSSNFFYRRTFCIEFEVKRFSVSTSSYEPIISIGNVALSGIYMLLRYQSNGANVNLVVVNPEGSNSIFTVSLTSSNTNKIIIYIEPGVGFKLSVNGSISTETTRKTPTGNFGELQMNKLAIGAAYNFNGFIKNFRAYNDQVFNDTDLGEIYNSGFYNPTENLSSHIRNSILYEIPFKQENSRIVKSIFGKRDITLKLGLPGSMKDDFYKKGANAWKQI